MFKTLKVKFDQGRQYIPNVRNAKAIGFRGAPTISDTPCEEGCNACISACPDGAIAINPIKIDLGRCTFCSECSTVCPVQKIKFTEEFKMATDSREKLVIQEGINQDLTVKVSREIKRVFGRSLKIRSVSAGGCNACELEIGALSNVNFDIGRFGIEFVASPRHADALVLSGPITKNMNEALNLAYEGMPDPKFVIAVGACAISGGLYEKSVSTDRTFLTRFQPSLYIPGCPPHPLTFLNGVLDLLGKFN